VASHDFQEIPVTWTLAGSGYNTFAPSRTWNRPKIPKHLLGFGGKHL